MPDATSTSVDHVRGEAPTVAPVSAQPPPLQVPSRWQRQQKVWLPLLSVIVVGLMWEYGVRYFDISRIVLPPLSEVLDAWWKGFVTASHTGVGADFRPHLWVTMKEVIVGFTIGLCIGVVTGALVALVRVADLTLKPFIVAIYATPKIAIAPLLTISLGFGPTSKVAVVALVAWMPIFTNVVTGLRAIEPPRIDLLTVMGASPTQILRKVRIPMALPYLFSGIRTAILLSMLGAVAAEFVGAQAGVGYIMVLRMSLLDTASVLALVLTLMVIGVVLYEVVDWLQRKTIFWS